MHIDSQRLGDLGTGLLTLGVAVGVVVVVVGAFFVQSIDTSEQGALVVETLLGLGLLLSPMLITSGATLIAVAKALTLPTPADPDPTDPTGSA